MKYPFLTKISQLVLIASFPMFASCVNMTATQRNLTKIDKIVPELRPNQNPTPVPDVSPNEKKKEEESNQPVPLSRFLSPNLNPSTQFLNSWFRKVLDWTDAYKKIAIEEKNVRNYRLSEKYSKISWMWAERADQIRKLSEDKANLVVATWLDELKAPKLPESPVYFSGQDAFRNIEETKNILDTHKKRMCLTQKGFQIVQSMAYLEFSIDMLLAKNYSKSYIMAQNALSLVTALSMDRDPCETEDDRSPTSGTQ